MPRAQDLHLDTVSFLTFYNIFIRRAELFYERHDQGLYEEGRGRKLASGGPGGDM